MTDVTEYRVGNHQPQNVYRGDEYIGVMFSPIDAAAVVRHLNAGVGECTCNSYEPCAGECCGVGMCSCTPAPGSGVTDELVDAVRNLIDERGSTESVREALIAAFALREVRP